MERTSSMFEKEVTITLSAAGKNKTEAVGNIFSLLRKGIYKEVPGIVVQMEPINFFVDNIDVKKYTERFLFLFMPREKEEVKLTATVVVSVKYVYFK
ncbi:MAG: hypothetical protein K0R54_1928 [Clostridiaceae bacterium]|jgi:uncharacterized protein (TIGR03578 family)|nr:hypothetical protein [Clostridiaceae bacterium]